MRLNRSLSCAAALLVGLLGGTSLYAQSDQPSLAEIAKQKSGVRAKRVVTNDQIPPSPEANNPPAAAAKGAATPANKNAAAKPEAAPDPQLRVQQLTAENADLHKVIAKLQEKIDTASDKDIIPTLNEAVQHAKTALANNQAEIDKLNAGSAGGQTAGTPSSGRLAEAAQPSTK